MLTRPDRARRECTSRLAWTTRRPSASDSPPSAAGIPRRSRRLRRSSAGGSRRLNRPARSTSRAPTAALAASPEPGSRTTSRGTRRGGSSLRRGSRRWRWRCVPRSDACRVATTASTPPTPAITPRCSYRLPGQEQGHWTCFVVPQPFWAQAPGPCWWWGARQAPWRRLAEPCAPSIWCRLGWWSTSMWSAPMGPRRWRRSRWRCARTRSASSGTLPPRRRTASVDAAEPSTGGERARLRREARRRARMPSGGPSRQG
mmetsp:Transcript_31277/g.101017  ORF Transcript_31277/g.101017 Transcript_31277/m.101017 type:complete len:258 (+) Transcript_31277:2068-2841(+)